MGLFNRKKTRETVPVEPSLKYQYAEGVTNDKKDYYYFFGGVIDGKYNGLSALWWKSGGLTISNFNNGKRDGFTYYCRDKNTFDICLYSGWDQRGSIISAENGDLRIGKLNDQGHWQGKIYNIRKGRKILVDEYDDGNIVKKGYIDFVVKGDVLINTVTEFETGENIKYSDGVNGYSTYYDSNNMTGLGVSFNNEFTYFGYLDEHFKPTHFGIHGGPINNDPSHHLYSIGEFEGSKEVAPTYHYFDDNSFVSIVYKAGNEYITLLYQYGNETLSIGVNDTTRSPEDFKNLIVEYDDDIEHSEGSTNESKDDDNESIVDFDVPYNGKYDFYTNHFNDGSAFYYFGQKDGDDLIGPGLCWQSDDNYVFNDFSIYEKNITLRVNNIDNVAKFCLYKGTDGDSKDIAIMNLGDHVTIGNYIEPNFIGRAYVIQKDAPIGVVEYDKNGKVSKLSRSNFVTDFDTELAFTTLPTSGVTISHNEDSYYNSGSGVGFGALTLNENDVVIGFMNKKGLCNGFGCRTTRLGDGTKVVSCGIFKEKVGYPQYQYMVEPDGKKTAMIVYKNNKDEDVILNLDEKLDLYALIKHNDGTSTRVKIEPVESASSDDDEIKSSSSDDIIPNLHKYDHPDDHHDDNPHDDHHDNPQNPGKNDGSSTTIPHYHENGYHYVERDNQCYFGPADNDKFEGFSALYDKNQYFIGEVSNGVRNGFGFYHPNNFNDDYLIGVFKDGVLNGKGIMRDNKRLYVGRFVDGKLEGKGFILEKGQKIQICTFAKGEVQTREDFDFVIPQNITLNFPDQLEPVTTEVRYNFGTFDDGGEYERWDGKSGDNYLAVCNFFKAIQISQTTNEALNVGPLVRKQVGDFNSYMVRMYDNDGEAYSPTYTYKFDTDDLLIFIDTDGDDFLIQYNANNGLQVARSDDNGKLKNLIEVSPEDDPDEDTTTRVTKVNPDDIDYEAKLAALIGLENVKTIVNNIKAFALKNDITKTGLHMSFTGNPGTGKTEVARLLAGILYKEGIISKPDLIETDRSGLVAKFVGQSSIKTHELVKKAMGGVLFIDEAYSLTVHTGDSDFGYEAVQALLKDMEDYRGKFICILAGYTDEMNELFRANSGFESRVLIHIPFPDYTRKELSEIGKLMLKDINYTLSDETMDYLMDVVMAYKGSKNFANARTVRNVLTSLQLIQAGRTANELNNREITIEDIDTYIETKKITFNNTINILPNDAIKADIKGIFERSKLPTSPYTIDVKTIEESVISLSCTDEDGAKSESSGSIISPLGICSTCAHCVKGAKELKARLNFYTRHGNLVHQVFDCKILAVDSKNDVALIQLQDVKFPLTYCDLRDEAIVSYEPLDPIVMAGYPLGQSTLNEISFNEGKVQSNNLINDAMVCYVDLSGRHGNSGSGVIDSRSGRLIGVFSGSITSGRDEINFFRPLVNVYNLLKDLLNK